MVLFVCAFLVCAAAELHQALGAGWGCRAVRHRRGALREPVGARLPDRLHAPGYAARPRAVGAHHGAHRDSERQGPRRRHQVAQNEVRGVSPTPHTPSTPSLQASLKT